MSEKLPLPYTFASHSWHCIACGAAGEDEQARPAICPQCGSAYTEYADTWDYGDDEWLGNEVTPADAPDAPAAPAP